MHVWVVSLGTCLQRVSPYVADLYVYLKVTQWSFWVSNLKEGCYCQMIGVQSVVFKVCHISQRKL